MEMWINLNFFLKKTKKLKKKQQLLIHNNNKQYKYTKITTPMFPQDT